MHPLLHVQPADVGHDGLMLRPQPRALAQGLAVLCLVVDRLDRVVDRNERVLLRVPHVVVDAVEYAAELLSVDVEDVAKAAPLIGMAHLPRVLRRYGGDEVRVDDGSFGEVDRRGIEIVAQAIL